MHKILLAIILSAVSASAVTLAQARTRVDDWLAARWDNVVARQETYFANHGRYWQGLITHVNVPNHLTAAFADAVADRLDQHPTDQQASWTDAIPGLEGIAIPCALEITAYQSPAGHGWHAQIWVRFNGTTYTRSRNVGPENEDYRTHAWAVWNPGQ